MHPITVGAAGHGLVGAGSVIGLCPRSLGYALTAWTLPSWCTIGDFIGIFHGKYRWIYREQLYEFIYFSQQTGAMHPPDHFWCKNCVISYIFCAFLSMNSYNFLYGFIFLWLHTLICVRISYIQKQKQKNRAGDSNHDPNTFYQTLPTTTPSSPYLAAIFCIISLYYIIIWFSRARKWCRRELK
jgi:hypothetical protein